MLQTAEEHLLKYIPNGAVNIKGIGLGDGKAQYKYEKQLMIKMLEEFADLNLKTKKYSEEDMMVAFKKGMQWQETQEESEGRFGEGWSYKQEFESFIKFLK